MNKILASTFAALLLVPVAACDFAPNPPAKTPGAEQPSGGNVAVGETLVFDGDFDTGDLSQYSNVQAEGINGSPDDYCGRVCVVNDGAGHETAAKFILQPGDDAGNGDPGGNRTELRVGDAGDVVSGDERWYEFALKFDESFTAPDSDWFIVMQWHAGDGSPPLTLSVDSDGTLQFTNNRTGDVTPIGEINPGVWTNYVVHVQFSEGDDGVAEAWVNGTKTATHTTPNMASGSNYLKLGMYSGGIDNEEVLFYDDLQITE